MFQRALKKIFVKEDRFTVQRLSRLHERFVSNPVLTEKNGKLIVETLREISEVLIYGDQNDKAQLFDFFLEKNFLSYIVSLMSQPSGREVKVQLIQTLSILIQNLSRETSIYYILSNNHINELIMAQYDFSDEELLAYYISLLKTVSLKLNKNVIQFFFNRRTLDFPLYTEAIKFFNHSESMVRIAVRTLTLNVFKVDDPAVRKYILDRSAAPYFTNLLWFIRERVVELDKLVMRGWAVEDQIAQQVAEHLDNIYYLIDIFDLGIPEMNLVLADKVLEVFAFPLLLSGVAGGAADDEVPHKVSRTVALCLIAQLVVTMTSYSVVNRLTVACLHPSPGMAVYPPAPGMEPAPVQASFQKTREIAEQSGHSHVQIPFFEREFMVENVDSKEPSHVVRPKEHVRSSLSGEDSSSPASPESSHAEDRPPPLVPMLQPSSQSGEPLSTSASALRDSIEMTPVLHVRKNVEPLVYTPEIKIARFDPQEVARDSINAAFCIVDDDAPSSPTGPGNDSDNDIAVESAPPEAQLASNYAEGGTQAAGESEEVELDEELESQPLFQTTTAAVSAGSTMPSQSDDLDKIQEGGPAWLKDLNSSEVAVNESVSSDRVDLSVTSESRADSTQTPRTVVETFTGDPPMSANRYRDALMAAQASHKDKTVLAALSVLFGIIRNQNVCWEVLGASGLFPERMRRARHLLAALTGEPNDKGEGVDEAEEAELGKDAAPATPVNPFLHRSGHGLSPSNYDSPGRGHVTTESREGRAAPSEAAARASAGGVPGPDPASPLKPSSPTGIQYSREWVVSLLWILREFRRYSTPTLQVTARLLLELVYVKSSASHLLPAHYEMLSDAYTEAGRLLRGHFMGPLGGAPFVDIFEYEFVNLKPIVFERMVSGTAFLLGRKPIRGDRICSMANEIRAFLVLRALVNQINKKPQIKTGGEDLSLVGDDALPLARELVEPVYREDQDIYPAQPNALLGCLLMDSAPMRLSSPNSNAAAANRGPVGRRVFLTIRFGYLFLLFRKAKHTEARGAAAAEDQSETQLPSPPSRAVRVRGSSTTTEQSVPAMPVRISSRFVSAACHGLLSSRGLSGIKARISAQDATVLVVDSTGIRGDGSTAGGSAHPLIRRPRNRPPLYLRFTDEFQCLRAKQTVEKHVSQYWERKIGEMSKLLQPFEKAATGATSSARSGVP